MKIKYSLITFIVFISVYLVFNISYKTQNARENLMKIKLDIMNFENDIHLLKVEWSYLTNPKKIEQLAQKHLNLKIQTQDNIKINETQLAFND
jgi:cell division protein FtsL